MVVISIIVITLIIFEYESDLRGNEHFLSSSKNKAWKEQFQACMRELNRWPLRYWCSVLPLSYQANWELVILLLRNEPVK